MDYTNAAKQKVARLSQYMSLDKIKAFALDSAFTEGKRGEFTLGAFWCAVADEASLLVSSFTKI